MPESSPGLTPSQRAALKPWADDASHQLRSVLEVWRRDDEAARVSVAWMEEYLAADRKRQRAMGKEARDGYRQKHKDGADESNYGVGSVKESLSALHYLLEEAGLRLQSATIGKALSEWNSTTAGLPPPTLRKAFEDALVVVEALLVECDPSSYASAGTANAVRAPFGSVARRVYLDGELREIERTTVPLIDAGAKDVHDRKLASVGFHAPTVETVFRAFDKLLERALDFDRRAEQYQLQRVKCGENCENPFAVDKERQLIEFVERTIQRLPGWIRSTSSGRVIWAVADKGHDDGLCGLHRHRIVQRIQLEYPQLRAQFDLECRSLAGALVEASLAGDRMTAGIPPAANLLKPPPRNTVAVTPVSRKLKRSTEPGEAKAKIVAALTLHHEFDSGGEGSCTNVEPVGVNQLAGLADVASSTVTEFFNENFGEEDSDGHLKGGHRRYKTCCHRVGKLVHALRVLQGDLKPRELLFGRNPPTDGRSRDDD